MTRNYSIRSQYGFKFPAWETFKEATRVQTKLCRKNSNSCFRESSTLLDVILHNDILITDTLVIVCPLIDNKFVAASIKIDKPDLYKPVILTRSLSDRNLQSFTDKLATLEYTIMDKNKQLQ